MTEIIGKLHPALVHLPIGILICAIAMDLLGRKERWKSLDGAVNFMLISGLATSILSIISGYTLSLDGSYDTSAVAYHQWTAIATTLVAMVYVWKRKAITQSAILHTVSALVLLSMITATGHQGGTLTHGEGFLSFTDATSAPPDSEVTPPSIPNIDSAIAYRDMIQYTLDTKCVSCHGPQRQKGKLRLDGKEWIQKGGKTGLVIDINAPEKSELLKRLLLDMNDDLHMPPKNKSQLTPDELALFQWWIGKGASYDKKVHEIGTDSLIEIHLNKIKDGYAAQKGKEVIMRKPVAAADPNVLKSLEDAGWVISPVAAGQNHLRATGFNITDTVNIALKNLLQISGQLVELKLSDCGADDSTIAILFGFQQLEKLWLDNNHLGDAAFNKIGNWSKLEYVNLSHTEVGEKSVFKFASLPKMKVVYAGFTNLNKPSTDSMMKVFQGKSIRIQDSMVRFESDTMFIKKTLK